MKKWFCIIVALLALSGCSVVVPPGYEGIKVNNTGSHRGTEDYPIQVGRVFYNAINEDVYQYPTFKHNYVWAQSGSEGSKDDESISFNSVEGTNLNADVGVILNVKTGSTPHIFVAYRAEMQAIINGPVRNEVRKFLNERAGHLKVMQIIGEQKGALVDSVLADMQNSALGRYVDFESISFTSNIRVPDAVRDAINSVNQATSAANAAYASVAKARADSISTVVAAQAEAEANIIKARSITPELINYLAVKQWDGAQPMVMGSNATPLIQLKTK